MARTWARDYRAERAAGGSAERAGCIARAALLLAVGGGCLWQEGINRRARSGGRSEVDVSQWVAGDRDAGWADADIANYWRACAALRAGDLSAGLKLLLDHAWVRSPALRRRVRATLAEYGLTVRDDALPIGGAA